MRIRIVKAFDAAPDHIHIRRYDVGEMDVEDEVAEIATRAGWAERGVAAAPEQRKGKRK